jgi:hypothetical protein
MGHTAITLNLDDELRNLKSQKKELWTMASASFALVWPSADCSGIVGEGLVVQEEIHLAN